MTDVTFSSDSTLIAFCCDDGSVGVYNIKSKKIEKYYNDHKPDYPIVSVAFNCND